MTDITAKLAEALERIADPRNTHFAGDARVVAAAALDDYRQHTEAQAGGTEGEHEAFEAWAKDKLGTPYPDADAWRAWQARAALAAAPAAAQGERETLLRVIQRLNQNPYSLTKGECIDVVREMMDAAPVTQPAAPVVQTNAVVDVLAERQRQISVEGWTPESDDRHVDGAMASAAACYALATDEHRLSFKHLNLWPWSLTWWKPNGRRRNLIKAGALILAEIERLDRAAAAPKTGGANG